MSQSATSGDMMLLVDGQAKCSLLFSGKLACFKHGVCTAWMHASAHDLFSGKM